MSQTKTKKTEQAKVEVGNFRLKITNLRTSAFPDPLTASDYHGYKVGDILIKGRTNNTIFEVNFGACWVKIKTLVRGGKPVTTSRVTRFCEVNFYKNNPSYIVADLATIANTNNSAANYIDYQINKLQAKQKRHRDTELAVLSIIKARVDEN